MSVNLDNALGFGPTPLRIGKAEGAFARHQQKLAAHEKEVAARDAARQKGLDESLASYTPELDKVFQKDTDQINQMYGAYQEGTLGYHRQGINHLDPQNTQAYREMRGAEREIEASIAQSSQHRELYENSLKFINDSVKKSDRAASQIRMAEFLEAGSIAERQAVIDKYGGNLVVPKTLDLGKYERDNEIDPNVRVGASNKGSFRVETQYDVRDEKWHGYQADTWIAGDPEYAEALRNQFVGMPSSKQQLIEAEASKHGWSIEKTMAYQRSKQRFPFEEVITKSTSKQLPRATSGGRSTQTRERAALLLDQFSAFDRIDKEFFSTYDLDQTQTHGGQAGQVNIANITTDFRIGTYRPGGRTTQPGQIVATGPGPFPGGIPQGSQPTSAPNFLEYLVEYNGEKYYATTQTINSGAGLTLNYLDESGAQREVTGMVPLRETDLQQLMLGVANELKGGGAGLQSALTAEAKRRKMVTDNGVFDWNPDNESSVPSYYQSQGSSPGSSSMSDEEKNALNALTK